MAAVADVLGTLQGAEAGRGLAGKLTAAIRWEKLYGRIAKKLQERAARGKRDLEWVERPTVPLHLLELWQAFWDLHTGHGGEQRLPDVIAYVDALLEPATRADRNYLVQVLWGLTGAWRAAPGGEVEVPHRDD